MHESISSDADAIRKWLLDRVTDSLQIPPSDIAPDVPLVDYGLTSVTAVAFCADIEDEFGVEFDIAALWGADTIEGIVARLISVEA